MGERLITGATDGIGRELARLWRGRGERTWLHGRRPSAELDPALFPQSGYLRADLRDPGAPEALARALDERQVDSLELLLLNAAEGWFGPLAEHPLEGVRALLEVDLFAPLHLTHLLLPRLRRARGRVAFVSSIAAQMASPEYAVYAAAKAAAEGFFRSLAAERPQIEVQVLRLGAVRTRLHEKSGMPRGSIPWERFPEPAEVAHALDRALAGSARWRTLGAANRAVFALGRSLPAVIDRLRTRGSLPPDPAPGARRRVAITGAAQGIGRALAERFARAGCELVLIDVDAVAGQRARSELRRQGSPAELMVADLSRAGEIEGVLHQLARARPVDVFVHNAGINAVGRFGALSWADQRRVLELNLVAPIVLTSGLLRAHGLASGGSFVFLSSLSRFVSYPGASVYAASKDGLGHYARSLRAALAPTGAHVLTVYPGPTRTEHARRHSPHDSREEQRMPPEDLAERVFRALERRRNVLVPGLTNTLMAAAGHLAPRTTAGWMRKLILDRLPG